MMGVITLNSLLRQTSSVTGATAGIDSMPGDFARTYFRHVGDHGDALWYVPF